MIKVKTAGKYLVCLLVLACFAGAVRCQLVNAGALTIGDTVHNLPLPHDIASRLPGKLLILDFMATTCKGCIEAIPRMDSIQQALNDSVQIVLVTYENRERVNLFLENNHIGKQIKLPMVVGDSILTKIFPHESISHIVWIDRQGLVRAITYSEYVTRRNVQAILHGEKINWLVKPDAYTRTIPVKPPVRFFSSISPFDPKIPTTRSQEPDSANRVFNLKWSNVRILDLYAYAFKSLDLPHSQVIIPSHDRGRFIYDKTKGYLDVWDNNNRFTYEGRFPLGQDEARRREKIIHDLDYFFQLHGTFQKRWVDCWIITRKEGARPDLQDDPTNSLGNIIWSHNNEYGAVPMLNESGIDAQKIQLKKNDYNSLSQLRSELSSLGFALTIARRKLTIMQLEDKDSNPKISPKQQ